MRGGYPHTGESSKAGVQLVTQPSEQPGVYTFEAPQFEQPLNRLWFRGLHGG